MFCSMQKYLHCLAVCTFILSRSHCHAWNSAQSLLYDKKTTTSLQSVSPSVAVWRRQGTFTDRRLLLTGAWARSIINRGMKWKTQWDGKNINAKMPHGHQCQYHTKILTSTLLQLEPFERWRVHALRLINTTFKQAHAERPVLGATWPQGMCTIRERLPSVKVCANVSLLAGSMHINQDCIKEWKKNIVQPHINASLCALETRAAQWSHSH